MIREMWVMDLECEWQCKPIRFIYTCFVLGSQN